MERSSLGLGLVPGALRVVLVLYHISPYLRVGMIQALFFELEHTVQTHMPNRQHEGRSIWRDMITKRRQQNFLRSTTPWVLIRDPRGDIELHLLKIFHLVFGRSPRAMGKKKRKNKPHLSDPTGRSDKSSGANAWQDASNTSRAVKSTSRWVFVAEMSHLFPYSS